MIVGVAALMVDLLVTRRSEWRMSRRRIGIEGYGRRLVVRVQVLGIRLSCEYVLNLVPMASRTLTIYKSYNADLE